MAGSNSRSKAPQPGPPLWLLAELTYRCPLHCVYCSNPLDFAAVEDELTTEEWKKVLREARALGAVQLGLSGGEPLQRDDLAALVREGRGLGFISQSALKIHRDYAEYDAECKFDMPGVRVADPKACQCGEVLKGVIKPWECKVFGSACTPEHAIGTCMVSPEGACAAYYNYGRFAREREVV